LKRKGAGIWELGTAICALGIRDLAAQSSPIIVKIIEPKKDPISGLGQVFLNALGLTGVIVLGAVACAAIFAGVLYWLRSRST
jgi:hypothetical protein